MIRFYLYAFPLGIDPETGNQEVKIGYTDNLDERLREYRRTHPKNTYSWTQEVESKDTGTFFVSGSRIYVKTGNVKKHPDDILHDVLRRMKNVTQISHLREDSRKKEKLSEVFSFKKKDYVSVIKDAYSYVVSYDWNRKKIRDFIRTGASPHCEVRPYRLTIWQALNNADKKDLRKNGLMVIQEDACPRFGKTLSQLDDFLMSDKHVMILSQYWLSPITSFLNEWGKYLQFVAIEDFFDLSSMSIEEIDNLPDPKSFKNTKVIFCLSLCGPKDGEKMLKIFNYLNRIPSDWVMRKTDEADFGAGTEKSQEKMRRLQPDSLMDVFSGTEADKIAVNFDLPEGTYERRLAWSYVELLLIEKKNHYIFDSEYLKTLDPKKHENRIAVLKDFHKNPSKYFDPKELGLIHPRFFVVNINSKLLPAWRDCGVLPEEGSSFVKINSDPKKYMECHLDFFKRFLGAFPVTTPLSHTKPCGHELRVMMVFMNGKKKENVEALCIIMNEDPRISKKYVFVPMTGDYTTNKEAEKWAKEQIVKAEKQDKGVIFVSLSMGQRSFSVSEIEAVLFYCDKINYASFQQKFSRALTPGRTAGKNSKIKREAFVFVASLTPNESMVDEYIETEIKNQTRGNTSYQEAAEAVYEAIRVHDLDGENLSWIERKSFDVDRQDKFMRRIAKRESKDEREDFYDLIEKNSKDFDLLLEELDKSKRTNEKTKDILRKLVRDSRATAKKKGQSRKVTNARLELYRRMMILYGTIYNTVLNAAAVYATINNCDLSSVKNLTYKDVLSSLSSSKIGRKEFSKMLGFENNRTIEILLDFMLNKMNIKWNRLTSKMHLSIEHTAYGNDLKFRGSDISEYLYLNIRDGIVHTNMKIAEKIVESSPSHKGTCIDPSCKTGTLLRAEHDMRRKLGQLEREIQRDICGYEKSAVLVTIAKHVSGIKNIFVREGDIDMEFDVVLMNPPYNYGLHETFLIEAMSLSKRYVVSVQPAGWFVAENKNQKVIDVVRKSIKKVILFNGNPVFGINGLFVPCGIFVIDKEHKSEKIHVIDETHDKRNLTYDKIEDVNIFTDYTFNDIKKRVLSWGGESLFDYIGKKRGEYLVFVANIRGNEERRGKNAVTDDFYTFVPRDRKVETKWNKKYQVFSFTTRKEAENFLSYLKTDFARICLSIMKFNKNMHRGALKNVPWLDFTKTWTDEALFGKFGFTKKEVFFVKKNLPVYYE